VGNYFYLFYNPAVFVFRSGLAAVAVLGFILTCFATVYTQVSINSENTVTIDDAPEMEVFSYGKTVVVKHRAKGVLSFGGDIIVEGKVEGDVAAIGGSVIQTQNGYIGGDVIILGGKYKPESSEPLREAGQETLMYAGYEEELRELSQDPTMIFAPTLTLTFLAQRVLSVLFWFVVSLGLATLAPGAVSRAVARFQLSSLKILAIGIGVFLVSSAAVIVSLRVLPNFLGAIFGLMVFAMLMLTYVFGRVALHVAFGKMIQKYVSGGRNHSESLAILFGVVFWTLLLSIPYVWTLAVLALFSAGVGLVLTSSTGKKWAVR
jgi:hypothetical protein